MGSWVLRRAADAYDRAARAPYGRIPRHTSAGAGLRAAARVMALTGEVTGDTTLVTVTLIANLVAWLPQWRSCARLSSKQRKLQQRAPPPST